MSKPPNGGAVTPPFWGDLQLDNSTLECKRYSMGTIVGTELGKYAAYMALDRFVRD